MKIAVHLRHRLQAGTAMDIKHADGNSMASVDMAAVVAAIPPFHVPDPLTIGQLTVTGNTELNYLLVDGNIDANGDTTLNFLFVNGDTELFGDLQGTTATFSGAVEVDSLTVDGALNVDGDTELNALFVDGDTQLFGDLQGTTATFAGDVEVDGNLTASWLFCDNFSVSGATLTLQTIAICNSGSPASMYVLGSGPF